LARLQARAGGVRRLHKAVEVNAPAESGRQGGVERVHQHGFAAADAAPQVDALDRRRTAELAR